MGEYTGRRRGRAADEPPAQEPGYPYVEEPSYQQGYLAGNQDPYAQQQPEGYGYEYGYEQPAAEYPVAEYYSASPTENPSYESGYAQGYEQQQPQYGYEYGQDPAYGYQNAPSYEQYPSYDQHPAYAGDPSYETGYEAGAYYDSGTHEPYIEGYTEDYAQGYQEPYYEETHDQQRRRTRSAPAEDSYGSYREDDYDYGSDDQQRFRAPHPPLSLLPYSAAATVALAIAAFVSTKAIAAVVLPLQLVVAWAVLDLAGFASRRLAVVVALPALAGTVGTFKFQPDDAVLPVAAGLGVGFLLVAADAVFRARRRGVEPGTMRSLAAAASALLFTGLTGLFLPAAALHTSSVAIGAAVCGLVSLTAIRNPDLAVSRAAVVAVPVTVAALASYAAAILVA